DQGRAQTRTARSDATGRFTSAFDSRASSVRVDVAFEGDDFYERAEASQTVEVDRSALRLRFVSPNDWRISLDDESTTIALQASSEVGGNDLSIGLQDELGRTLAEGRTDRQGALALTLSNNRFGEVGVGELVAISKGDATRSAARASQPILRTRATSLRLSARPDPNTQAVAIALQLTAAKRPLPQRAVGVFLDGEHLVTLLTDRNGDAKREFGPTTIRPGRHELVARFESDAPGWIASHSASVPLALAEISPRSAVWLIVPALASLAFVLWSLRRRHSDERRDDEPGEAPSLVRFGAADRGRAEVFVLDGRVEDVENAEPIAATLEISDARTHVAERSIGADGVFVTEALPAGAYRVRIAAPGYASAAFEIELPHAGAASNMVIALRNLRSVALDAHASVARRVFSSDASLHIATVRDTLAAAVSGNTSSDAIVQLSELVERTAYARATPNDRDLEEVQRTAAEVLADIDARSSSSGDPSLEQ
ncbi:MAG TPA: carboxypeptidase-like regulatory domain-containing protein, partial [Polyangiales bacterium]|nr:carboxypeptidase-like regulatory domain-containing protein [Polyangiales bacterium]